MRLWYLSQRGFGSVLCTHEALKVAKIPTQTPRPHSCLCLLYNFTLEEKVTYHFRMIWLIWVVYIFCCVFEHVEQNKMDINYREWRVLHVSYSFSGYLN